MFNPLDLTGKTILVTGASSGIGQGTAVYLSRLGAKIVAVGRDINRLQQVEEQMEGRHHAAVEFDVNNIEQIPAWLKEISAAHGALFGLVHSAGASQPKPLKVLNYKTLLETQRINVDAAIMLAKGFRQLGVCEQSGSSIVLISSVAALKGEPALAAYSGQKAALIGLARTLGIELASQKIRVNCVSPALVMTPMAEGLRSTLPPEKVEELERKHPLGLGYPEDVAYAIAWLLAPAARWVTGINLVLDGGYTA